MKIINEWADNRCHGLYRTGRRLGITMVCSWPALLSGCAGIQSALDPKGPAAQAISQTWWIMFWGTCAILSLVMVLVCYAVFRRPDRRLQIKGVTLIISGGLVLPTITLATLLVYGTHIGNTLWVDDAFITSTPEETLKIQVTGNQWWWEVRYPNAILEQTIITANEIHIPAAKPVEIALTTDDVIHSFWVPSLAGKLDMIPGKVNTLRLLADEPGVFRGQCAEFCGAQHARMAFFVIAQSTADFAAWLENQRRPARTPDTPLLRRGRNAFLSVGCADCHTVRGTPPAGDKGPDLTHVGNRRTLAAGTLQNNPENLTAWIVNNQSIKPGNRMEPFTDLSPATLQAIVAYLESLK